MHEKFHPSVSFKYSTSFYQSNLLSIQMNKDKADVKKICFRSNGLKKTHPGSPKNFFSQKLLFRYFLKQLCSFGYCCSFQVVTFFFILLHRNFNITEQIFMLCTILKHIYYVMKTTYDIKISQFLLFKIVQFTHLNFKFHLRVKFQLLLLCFMMEKDF